MDEFILDRLERLISPDPGIAAANLTAHLDTILSLISFSAMQPVAEKALSFIDRLLHNSDRFQIDLLEAGGLNALMACTIRWINEPSMALKAFSLIDMIMVQVDLLTDEQMQTLVQVIGMCLENQSMPFLYQAVDLLKKCSVCAKHARVFVRRGGLRSLLSLMRINHLDITVHVVKILKTLADNGLIQHSDLSAANRQQLIKFLESCGASRAKSQAADSQDAPGLKDKPNTTKHDDSDQLDVNVIRNAAIKIFKEIQSETKPIRPIAEKKVVKPVVEVAKPKPEQPKPASAPKKSVESKPTVSRSKQTQIVKPKPSPNVLIPKTQPISQPKTVASDPNPATVAKETAAKREEIARQQAAEKERIEWEAFVARIERAIEGLDSEQFFLRVDASASLRKLLSQRDVPDHLCEKIVLAIMPRLDDAGKYIALSLETDKRVIMADLTLPKSLIGCLQSYNMTVIENALRALAPFAADSAHTQMLLKCNLLKEVSVIMSNRTELLQQAAKTVIGHLQKLGGEHLIRDHSTSIFERAFAATRCELKFSDNLEEMAMEIEIPTSQIEKFTKHFNKDTMAAEIDKIHGETDRSEAIIGIDLIICEHSIESLVSRVAALENVGNMRDKEVSAIHDCIVAFINETQNKFDALSDRIEQKFYESCESKFEIIESRILAVIRDELSFIKSLPQKLSQISLSPAAISVAVATGTFEQESPQRRISSAGSSKSPSNGATTTTLLTKTPSLKAGSSSSPATPTTTFKDQSIETIEGEAGHEGAHRTASKSRQRSSASERKSVSFGDLANNGLEDLDDDVPAKRVSIGRIDAKKEKEVIIHSEFVRRGSSGSGGALAGRNAVPSTAGNAQKHSSPPSHGSQEWHDAAMHMDDEEASYADEDRLNLSTEAHRASHPELSSATHDHNDHNDHDDYEDKNMHRPSISTDKHPSAINAAKSQPVSAENPWADAQMRSSEPEF
eukprot:jgi/Hompol1/3389/HPOL_003238-RA